jgi:glycosyltransferase involved in cell wall biosynthesis
MSSGLVSVVIPTYNRATLLPRAVDSALQQTYRQVEVIIVDDGSTDDTPGEVARRYGEDPRVRYVRIPNGGVSGARNVGISLAKGDFVAFLDSDDYWLLWKIELQVKCLSLVPDAGMIWTNMTAVTDDGGVRIPGYLREMYGAYTRLDRERIRLFGDPLRVTAAQLGIEGFQTDINLCHADIYSPMILGNLVHTSTVLIRRERLRPVVGFRVELRVTGEDYDFHLRTCREGPVAFVDVDSIGYTIGRSDQLTSPNLSAQLAENSLLTLEFALASGSRPIELPNGAIERKLAEAHEWASGAYLHIGGRADARRHARKSIRAIPFRPFPYVLLCASLLPSPVLAMARSLYRRIKNVRT